MQTALTMWTTSARLHSAELTGCFSGCSAQYERDSVGDYPLCHNLRNTCLAVGERPHPRFAFFGMVLGLISEARATGLAQVSAAHWL